MGNRNHGIAASCDSAVRDPLLVIFLIACVVTVLLLRYLLKGGRGQTHTGLTLTYLLTGFWMNYWFPVAAYLVPGYCGVFPEYMVPGARETLYAFLGFAAGVFFLPKLFGVLPSPAKGSAPAVPANLRYGLLVLGVLFAIALRFTANVKGVQAVLSSGQQLLVVAVVLSIWEAARKKRSKGVGFWLALSLAFPFITVVHDGFLLAGILSLAPVAVFATACIRRRNYFKLAIIGAAGCYLGLSLFVNYMRDRVEIRASVWGGDRFSGRVQRFAQIFDHFEWFSPANPKHLDPIAARMNAAWLVGAGVTYMENTKQWARGETLKYAAVAFVPRLLWRNKPAAGGNDIATRYTGLQFSEGTSVGIGQVMELYVNYGSWLVLFGFALFGGLAAYLDIAARKGLQTGNFNRFTTCYVIGLALINEGSLIALTVSSALMGLLLTNGLQMVLHMKSKRAPAISRTRVLRPYAQPTVPR